MMVPQYLDDLSVKLCEQMPHYLNLYEEKGRCTNPTDICKFCITEGKTPLCYKKRCSETLDSGNTQNTDPIISSMI